MISPATCRAARALLDWTQQQLADKAGVGVRAIRTYEARRTEMMAANRAMIEQALTAAGVEIIVRDNAPVGVRAAWEIMTPEQRASWLAELGVAAERPRRGRPRKAV